MTLIMGYLCYFMIKYNKLTEVFYMKLSVLVRNQRNLEILSISAPLQKLQIDEIPTQMANRVKSLSLNHCELQSLQGLQQFQNIQTLNLKYNQIRDINQLSYLTCKQSLKSLNITGNDIQNYYDCQYQQLKQIFPHLQELNGKDYKLPNLKKKQKKDMHKIMKQFNKISKELTKANKKPQPYRKAIQQIEQLSTKRIQQHPNYSEQNSFTRKKQPSIHIQRRVSNNCYKNQAEFIYLDMEHQKENHLEDISLSNIYPAKSVRNSFEGVSKKRNPLLQINVSQNSIERHNPIQPTATFAKQRQLSQKGNNNHFGNRSLSINHLLTTHQNYPQVCEEEQQYVSFSRTHIQCPVEQHEDDFDLEAQCIGDGLYLKNLRWKCLKAFRKWFNEYKTRIQLPMKRQFY